jgi:hypothetical protein
VIRSKDPRIPARLRIAPYWQPGRDEATGRILASGRLWDFTEKIASSRREGKNRRDGATVSTRVIALTDELGRKLFESAVRGEEEATRGKKGKGGAAPARLSDEEQRRVERVERERRRRRRLAGGAKL